jgi:hypothetical protein
MKDPKTMAAEAERQCVAFAGSRLIASGGVGEVALALKAELDRDENLSPLTFDAVTSEPVELDLRGTKADILRRLAPVAGGAAHGLAHGPARGPGRPKLGVVAREVTLLPRHWEWLGAQPGGASVALRRLVEAARRSGDGPDRTRRSRESAYRFMTAVAGDAPLYEEATRALFAGDGPRFARLIAAWPRDLRTHLARLAERAFEVVPPA